MVIFLLYSILMLLGGYYFYLVGYNEAHKDWLAILRADPTKTAGQLLEFIEKFRKKTLI